MDCWDLPNVDAIATPTSLTSKRGPYFRFGDKSQLTSSISIFKKRIVGSYLKSEKLHPSPLRWMNNVLMNHH